MSVPKFCPCGEMLQGSGPLCAKCRTDWAALLPSGAKVCYANPDFGCEKPWLYEEFLLVSFPDDSHVNVCWDYDKDCYVVTLSRNGFEADVAERDCKTAEEVRAAVKEFGRTVLADDADLAAAAERQGIDLTELCRDAGQHFTSDELKPATGKLTDEELRLHAQDEIDAFKSPAAALSVPEFEDPLRWMGT